MQDGSWRRSEVGNFGMRVKFFTAEPNFSVPGCGADNVLYGPIFNTRMWCRYRPIRTYFPYSCETADNVCVVMIRLASLQYRLHWESIIKAVTQFPIPQQEMCVGKAVVKTGVHLQISAVFTLSSLISLHQISLLQANRIQ